MSNTSELGATPAGDALLGLTPQQAAAATADGPVLVLAGAGTGKTKTLTAAVARRIRGGGVDPGRILAVTFTNKASAEMSARIRAALDGTPQPHWVGTFHGLAARQLRVEPEVGGLRPGFEILDADDSRRLVRRTMKALALDSEADGAGCDPVKVMCGRLSKFKDNLISPEEAPARVEAMIASAGQSGLMIDAPGMRESARLYGEYQRRLVEGNAADFGDLLLWRDTRASTR